MSKPILATKLYIPPTREGIVSRAHLIDILNVGLRGKLTLISAPAGFGKTTLISNWITKIQNQDNGNHQAFTYLSLDKDDNDPIRFWTYVIYALRMIKPGLGETELFAFQSSTVFPVEEVLSGLINEIDETLQNFVLILDDYFQIDEPQIHASIQFLLNNMPPQMNLVIATRVDPPLSLSRLRGQGYLTEIRTDELRFLLAEASEFLNGVMKMDMIQDDIQILYDHTEGWIVGLQLAAFSMRDRGDKHSYVADFAGDGRYIADFMVEEILLQQSDLIQTFLLRTAILERLSASLCDTVVGQLPESNRGFSQSFSPFQTNMSDSSQEILEYLDKSNLFLIPLDDRREWYRYHHLFADLLRARLGRIPPDQVASFHCRASTWYEEHDLPHDAVRHSLAAGEVTKAIALIESNALALIGHGEMATLVNWLEKLPAGLIHSRPWLSVYQAWMMMGSGKLEAVELLLKDAEAALGNSSRQFQSAPELHYTGRRPVLDDLVVDRFSMELSETKQIEGHIATIRACVGAFNGDQYRVMEFSRQALECLPKTNEMARGLALLVFGLALRWDGNLEGALSSFSEAETVGRACNDSYVTIFAACYKGYVMTLMGHLQDAIVAFQSALEYGEKSVRKGGWRPPIAGLAHTFMCSVLIERNNLDAALSSAKRGLELSQKWGHAYAITDGYFFLITTLIASGDYSGAKREIHNARNFANKISPFVSIDVLLLECRLHLVQGDVKKAARLISKLELNLDDQIEFIRFNHYLPLARIFLAKNQTREALDILTRLLELAESSGAGGKTIEILAIQAVAFYQKGDVDQAMNSLTHALYLAEPEGYIQPFLIEGAPMELLLHMAADSGIALEYVQKLLSNFNNGPRLDRLAISDEIESLVEPLSVREVQVLRLLNTNMTSVEIAAQLHLAPSTVQTHCKYIYQKLNVHRRFDVVQRARELGLL